MFKSSTENHTLLGIKVIKYTLETGISEVANIAVCFIDSLISYEPCETHSWQSTVLESNLNNLQQNVKVEHIPLQEALPFKVGLQERPYFSESKEF